MKLNTNSNAYIIIYSAILVVVVAFLLAFVYQALKPMQDANVALDVKKQILYSLNIRNLDGAEAEAKYAEVVKEEKELDGQKIYECQIDGQNIRVASLKGMGLWGGISGYVAIDKEGKVFGAYFNQTRKVRSLVPTSTMRVRQPALVPRSRILRLGRRNSSARRSSMTTGRSFSLL